MKHLFWFIVCIIGNNFMHAQGFFIGDTACNYKKINLSLNQYTLDVDGDLNSDISFEDFYYYCNPVPSGTCPYPNFYVRRIGALSSMNTEFVYGPSISASCGVSSMVQNLSYGTVLGSSLTWSSNPSGNYQNNIVHNYSPSTQCGQESTSFYMGFRKVLAGNDTVYGWILMDTNNPGKLISYAFKRIFSVSPVFTNTVTTVCFGNTLTLNSTSQNGLYNGYGVNGNAFQSLVTGVGTFQVYLSNSCTNVDTLDITVFPSPTPQITNTITSVCYGDTVLLQGTPVGGVFTGTGVVGNTFYSINAGTGSATVNYIVTNVNGCSTTAVKTINVEIVKITNTNTTLCAGNDMTLNGVPPGGIFSGDSTRANGFFSSVNAGSYTALYTYTNSLGCNNTASLVISVLPVPVIAFTNTTNTVCSWDRLILSVQPHGGTVWAAYGVAPNTINGYQFYNPQGYTDPVLVHYDFVGSNGCFATTTIVVQGVDCVGIREYENTDPLIEISPNPVIDRLKVMIKDYSSDQKIHLELFSSDGKSVRSSELFRSENDINVTDLPAGIYFVELNTGTGLCRKKFIVEK